MVRDVSGSPGAAMWKRGGARRCGAWDRPCRESNMYWHGRDTSHTMLASTRLVHRTRCAISHDVPLP